MRPEVSLGRIFIVLLIGLVISPSLATNGMNMIGYNIRSSGMGGADVAVDSDCSGASGNPAALCLLTPRSISAGISLLMPSLNVSNTNMGLDLDGESQIFPLPYLAYAQRMGSTSPWTLGIDIYAQGGMGVDFQGFPTGATTTDTFSSRVMYLRATAAAKYSVTENLSLGLSAIAGYAGMDFSMFPETVSGMDVEGLSSLGYSGRFGVHYKLCDRISVGAQYTSETELNLDGGDLTLNFGSMGGKVLYEAAMEDFTWPQEAELGFTVQAAPSILFAADVKWINWSGAMDVVYLVATNPPSGFPENPFPDGMGGYTNRMPFQMKWEDQWVYALGVEYSLNNEHALRFGFNYGKNPVPDENLSPLFPAIVESHGTLGYGLDLGQWSIDAAYEHAFENMQTNMNDDPMVNPFGPGISVSHSQNTFHLGAGFSF
ncbi:hypothetical protein DRQ25_05345 [Candidatus Fermentibacteria bacterium]|nr:MAG: hypothetical protein DRQ25_05345 [Candidatus Fermentibacteria bacterium]